jgi:uncharacterized caspase-like protein
MPWIVQETGIRDGESNQAEANTGPAEVKPEPAPLPVAETPLNIPQGNRALLIGIDRYANPELNLVGGSVNDVKLMKRLLIDSLGFEASQIKTLTNEQATKRAIMQAIDEWLINGTGQDDQALLFYSGHGYYQKDLNGDESDPFDETLVAHDAQLVSNTESPPVFKNLILDDEIHTRVQRLSNRKVTLVIDACHSGTMTRSLNGVDPKFVRTLAARLPEMSRVTTRSALGQRQKDESFIEATHNMVAWSAVSPVQQALVDTETNQYQGVFTGRFVKGIQQGLADGNKDGLVTYAELHDYLQRESGAYCTRNANNCKSGLTPFLEAPRQILATDVVTGKQAESSVEEAESLIGHDNQANLKIEILPRSVVQLGEQMKFRISSDHSGYLLVLDVNADGQLTQLYPNEFSDKHDKERLIKKGRSVTIPDAYYGFQLTAVEPTGAGALIALVTEDPLSLEDLLESAKDLEVIRDARSYMTQLAVRLRKPWPSGNRNRTMIWSMTKVNYRINP